MKRSLPRLSATTTARKPAGRLMAPSSASGLGSAALPVEGWARKSVETTASASRFMGSMNLQLGTGGGIVVPGRELPYQSVGSRRRLFLLISRAVAYALLALGAAAAPADENAVRHGVVRDPIGVPIDGADVELRGDGWVLPRVVSGPDGAFAFDPAGETAGTLVVRAAGYTRGERAWSIADAEPLVIVLERTGLREDVTVTAARGETRLGDTAARVTVLDEGELAATAAPTLDDALRQVPGFTLFRRTGSRVANPTSQGASMRGVGASGASRTLVLMDGLPLNDPFGGWVDWSRVPRIAVERVEVLEGGASDLYGSAALGGVIQALERSDAPALAVEVAGGTQGTGGISAYGGVHSGGWSARASGEAFTTDGYVLVPEDVRGPVDTEAGSEHLAGRLVVERRLRPGATVFVRGGFFGESRTNGTPLQTNDTDEQEVAAGADL